MSRVVNQTIRRLATLCAAIVALTLVGPATTADDRELLRERGADPYVFVVFDTSGSMNRSSVCTAKDSCEDFEPYDGACTSECTLGDETCAQVCPDFGCLQYTDVDAQSPVELVVDDTAINAADIVGTWAVQSPVGALNGNAHVANGNGNTVTFRQMIATTRAYKLFIHVPESDTWATNVPVGVSGTPDAALVRVNQRTPPPDPTVDPASIPPYDPWVLVGVFNFTAGDTAVVTIGTDGTADPLTGASPPVVADGIRFLSEVKECAPGQMGYRCQQPLCPDGDCNVDLNGDDPGSKFFQARQALYETLDAVSGVRFGFATFEQDMLQVFGKHWLYRVRALQMDPDTTDAIDPPAQTFFTLGTTQYPVPGYEDSFGLVSLDSAGFLWVCGPATPGCTFDLPAELDNPGQLATALRIPKLGENNNRVTQIFIRESAASTDVFRLTYTPIAASALGNAQFQVTVAAEICPDATCGTPTAVAGSPLVLAYDLRSDFLGVDGRFGNGIDTVLWTPNAPPGDVNAVPADFIPGCGHTTATGRTGWDPNDDTGTGFPNLFADFRVDQSVNYSMRWATTADPRSTAANNQVFDRGDVIPWDWEDDADHVEELQHRLAPNMADPSNTDPPDFRTARFLNDAALPADFPFHPFFRQLRARDDDQRSLIPRGFTPLGYSLDNVQNWFLDYSAEAGQVISQNDDGSDVTLDPDWSCREKFVLMLTDGDDTCSFRTDTGLLKGAPTPGINPSNVTNTLFRTHGVKTYVIGFGLSADEGATLNCDHVDDQLTCMATRGGTEAPIFPKNKDELTNALLDVFGEVAAESRAFASASLPAQQSTAADKIFFSSFTPLADEAYWAGRVDVFREPLLNVSEPPICDSCVRDGLESSCHLYNVADTILAQAPQDAEIDADPPNGNVGLDIGERRVLYAPDSVPAKPDGTMEQPQPLRLFQLPSFVGTPTPDELAIREDFEEVFLDDDQKTDTDAERVAHLKRVYRRTLRVKNSLDLADAAPCGTTRPVGVQGDYEFGDYLMGDVFHANPLISSGPSNLRFVRANSCGLVTPEPNTPANNCPVWAIGDDELAFERGYRNFVRRNRWLRRMLTVAANDGQLHFFDAGIRREIQDSTTLEDLEVFSDGTGTEIFSYMPRLTMPVVREQAADNATQIFSLDGSLTIGEILVDPVFELDPDQGDREWRTVVVGGLREGGDRFDDNRDIDGFVSGYYALDITQPDGLTVIDNDSADFTDDEYIPDDLSASGVLPSCLKIDAEGNHIAETSAACMSTGGESIPFPALKWEFTDRLYFFDTDGDAVDESGWFRLDEDLNGEHDLGATWSKPLVTQVLVLDGTDETTRWVAIFGGGIDPATKTDARRGNWLYMVDMETGVTIYKRPVVGAVPSDITGLDTNTDGIIDRLYFTTTGGFLYKVDLTSPGTFGTVTLEAVDITDATDPTPDGDLEGILEWPDENVTVDIERITNPEWEPFTIFDTGGRQLYQPPAVVAIQEREQFALAFGSGDREDLWEFDGDTARFYTILDDDFEQPTGGPTDLPYDETDFINIDFDAPLLQIDTTSGALIPGEGRGPTAPNFLTNFDHLDGNGTQLGWIMRFPEEARVNNRAFVLTGVLVFSVFQPQIDPELGGDQVLCRRTGLSRTFILDVRNANAITSLENFRDPSLSDDRGLEGGSGQPPGSGAGDPAVDANCGDRCLERDGFGTAPFVSSGSTKNPTTGTLTGSALDPLEDQVLRRLFENLKSTFFPPGCHFNDSFYEMIRMQFDDTGVQNLVPVPIGVCPSDWAAGTPNWSTD